MLLLLGATLMAWSAWTLCLGIHALRRARRPEDRNVCPHCGYDLGSLLTRRCPECGVEATLEQWDHWRAENAREIQVARQRLSTAVTIGVLSLLVTLCGGFCSGGLR